MYTAVFIGKPDHLSLRSVIPLACQVRLLLPVRAVCGLPDVSQVFTDSLPITRYTRCSSRRVCLLSTVVLCYILLRVLQTFRGKRP